MMKRLFRGTSLVTAAALAITCSGCGSKDKNATDLTGRWQIVGEGAEGGYVFSSGGQASIYICPEDIYFDDGMLVFGDAVITGSSLSFDGDILSADFQGTEILTLDRTGEPDSSTFNGEYVIKSGEVLDIISSMLGVSGDDMPEFRMNIADKSTTVTAVDIMEYSYDGKTFEFKGKYGLADSSGEAELSGDELAIKRSDGSERRLKRVSED